MIVEPPQEDLIRGEPQQILDSLSLFTETIQFGMKLYVDLAEQSTSDDLPDETEDKVFSAFLKILGTNVDHRASDSFRGRDNDVVILRHLESIDLFARARLVQNTHINRIRDRVVDEFTKDQPITTFVEQLHGVCGDRKSVADVRIAFEHRVYVISELGPLVLVNRMADVGVGTLNGDLSCLGRQATGGCLHFGMELRIIREYPVRYCSTRWAVPRPNPRARPSRLHQR